MVVDDGHCPKLLIHFGAVSVDFIMWSLQFTILIELSLGSLSGDHIFAYSFKEFVSFGIVIVCSLWKAGCPQEVHQFCNILCRCHGFLCLLSYLAWEHINLYWLGRIHAGHDVLNCQCWHEFSDRNAWTSLTDIVYLGTLIRKSKDYVYGIWLYKALGIWKGY